MRMSLRNLFAIGVFSLLAQVSAVAGTYQIDNSAPLTFVNGSPVSSNSLYCPTGQSGCNNVANSSLELLVNTANQMELLYVNGASVVPLAGYMLWSSPSANPNQTTASAANYTVMAPNMIVQIAPAGTTATYASFAGTFSMPGTQLVNNNLLAPAVTTNPSVLPTKYNPGLILTNPTPSDVVVVPEPSPAFYLLGALPFLAIYGRRRFRHQAR